MVLRILVDFVWFGFVLFPGRGAKAAVLTLGTAVGEGRTEVADRVARFPTRLRSRVLFLLGHIFSLLSFMFSSPSFSSISPSEWLHLCSNFASACILLDVLCSSGVILL